MVTPILKQYHTRYYTKRLLLLKMLLRAPLFSNRLVDYYYYSSLLPFFSLRSL